MTYTDILAQYAEARNARDLADATEEGLTVAVLKGFPAFVSGKRFTTITQELRAINERLVKDLAGSESAVTRNKAVGAVMEATGADDYARVRSINNKAATFGIGHKWMATEAASFVGTLDEWETMLDTKVDSETRLAKLKDDLAKLQDKASKLRRAIREIEESMGEVTF